MSNLECYITAPPVYQQIADDLRRRIESHAFTVGKPLPRDLHRPRNQITCGLGRVPGRFEKPV